MRPNILVHDDPVAFDGAAADWLASRLSGPATLGLATGGTPVGMYQELVRRYQTGEISFRNVRTFNLDEYVGLPADHPQSYRSFMRTHLFDHVDVDAENTYIPDGMASDPEAEARRYDRLLTEYGPIDAQVLGIGTNGHIGFNEPGTPFESRTHVIELAQATRESNARFFDSIDEVPRYAITVGIANILEAKAILLLARGANKAEALRRAFTEAPTPSVPASALQRHPNVTVIADREAAEGLL